MRAPYRKRSSAFFARAALAKGIAEYRRWRLVYARQMRIELIAAGDKGPRYAGTGCYSTVRRCPTTSRSLRRAV